MPQPQTVQPVRSPDDARDRWRTLPDPDLNLCPSCDTPIEPYTGQCACSRDR